MTQHPLIGRSRFPSARPARYVAANAVPWREAVPLMRLIAPHELSFRKPTMRSIRKETNGFEFILLLLLAAVMLALLVSCGSTKEINGTWVNPEAGKRSSVNKVLVIGINRNDTARQIYEDAIVAQLATRGIKAQPSYKLLLELGSVPPLDIKSMVRNAGVDAVLVSRTMSASTEIRVTSGHSDGPALFYRMWSGALSTAPKVCMMQNVEVETRLFDVKDWTLLWSGSSATDHTSSMQQAMSEFATVLINALADAKVIRGAAS